MPTFNWKTVKNNLPPLGNSDQFATNGGSFGLQQSGRITPPPSMADSNMPQWAKNSITSQQPQLKIEQPKRVPPITGSVPGWVENAVGGQQQKVSQQGTAQSQTTGLPEYSVNVPDYGFDKMQPLKPVSVPDPIKTQPETSLQQTSSTPQFDNYRTTEAGSQAFELMFNRAMNEDPQIQAERTRLERNSLLRAEQAKRTAHERAVQSGFMPGSAQYEQMMRSAVSDASAQNITAANAFQDFVRGRVSDQQRELENIQSGEYSRAREGRQDTVNEFRDLAAFLPSDKAQLDLLRAKLGGADLNQAFQGLFGPDGTLKPEHMDKNKAELVKAGIEQSVEQMNVNPETGKQWAGTEKQEFINKFYSDNFQNILYPSEQGAEQRDTQQARNDRIEQAIIDKSAASLTDSDWKNMTPEQLDSLKSEGAVLKFDSTSNRGDAWSDLDNLDTSDAKKKWLEKNPISDAGNKGKVYEKDGNVYEIIDPMRVVTLTGDNKRIVVIGKNLKTGLEEEIFRSSRFESKFLGLF